MWGKWFCLRVEKITQLLTSTHCLVFQFIAWHRSTYFRTRSSWDSVRWYFFHTRPIFGSLKCQVFFYSWSRYLHICASRIPTLYLGSGQSDLICWFLLVAYWWFIEVSRFTGSWSRFYSLIQPAVYSHHLCLLVFCSILHFISWFEGSFVHNLPWKIVPGWHIIQFLSYRHD